MSVISIGNRVPIPVVMGTGRPVKFSNRLDFPQDCAPAMTSYQISEELLMTEGAKSYPWQLDVFADA
jgi:hypothetical protein